MPTRAAVYVVIDGERDYQNNLPDYRTNGAPHSVGDYCTMLDSYMRRAIDAWTKHAGDHMCLHEIRKIAAIAVRCLEEHGARRGPLVPHQASNLSA